MISDAEAHVMDVLWERSPLTAEELVQVLSPRQDWQEGTVKSLLNRLLKKGAIRADRDGRRYLYAPVLERETWLAEQSAGLVDRLFGGRVAPLVAHFSEHGRLSREDLQALKDLVGRLDDER